LSNLARGAGILLEIFVNPLNLVGPLWPWSGAVLPVSLMLGGCVSLARRSWSSWALLVLPVGLAMIASAIQRYPFHGRMILELVPAFLLLIGEGSERLHDLDRSRGRLVYKVLVVLLLVYPCYAAIDRVAWSRLRGVNPHGDLHKNLFITGGEAVKGALLSGSKA
jgi:hypothetical protein